MLLSLASAAGCGPAESRVVGFWPSQEKSGAFGTGWGNGHVTPFRVLYSNQSCYTGTCCKRRS